VKRKKAVERQISLIHGLLPKKFDTEDIMKNAGVRFGYMGLILLMIVYLTLQYTNITPVSARQGVGGGQTEDTVIRILGEQPPVNTQTKPDFTPGVISKGTPANSAPDSKKGVSAQEGGPVRSAAGWFTFTYQDFEGNFPSGGWNARDNSGVTGVCWDDDTYRPYGGSWSAWAANGCVNGLDPYTSYYVDNMDSWMTYGPFSLSGVSAADFDFMYWNSSEYGFDYFSWCASSDGVTYYCTRVSGDSAGWQSVYYDLSAYLGDPSVYIAFIFTSDGSAHSYDGAFVDNITIWGLDTVAPMVTAFAATTPTANLNIPITAFTSYDAVGVAGYMITTSAAAPSAAATNWNSTAYTSFTVPSIGVYTLYPWVKDVAGNVSAVFGAPVTVSVVPPTYPLTASKGGTGTGTVTSSPTGIDCGATCSAIFNYNTSVILTATPATGSTFTGWSGDCTGTGTCTVTMSAAKSVTATFTLNTYALTVGKSGTGAGAVTSSPAGIDCGVTCSANFNYNTSFILTATPATGSTFAGWSGDCIGIGTCTVTMISAKSVTAIFNLLPKEQVKNGSFESKLSGWQTFSFISSTDGRTTSNSKEGRASVTISGTSGKTKVLKQELSSLTGLINDKFTFSFWVKGMSIGGVCQGQVQLYEGTTLRQTSTVGCKKGTYNSFQKKTKVFYAEVNYTKVVIKFTYENAGGTVWFDLISLIK
jgi:uncharacterized repeat protein (TIGR02543 family)